VSDERSETEETPAAPREPTGPPEAAPDRPGVADRRTFIRQLSGDAVVSAGRIAGLSTAFRRSLFAAGSAVTRELETSAGPEPVAGGPMPGAARPTAERETPEPPPPAKPGPVTGSPQPPAPPPADAVAGLTPDQHGFLARGERAVLSINAPTGAPHVSASIYHWDGAILRMPSQMFAARAQLVDQDPRVSVFIEDRTSGAWVVVTGLASLVYGDAVERETMLVLERSLSPGDAASRWDEMRARGDAVVVQVRPTHFLWRPG
jgi:hypothetical protein